MLSAEKYGRLRDGRDANPASKIGPHRLTQKQAAVLQFLGEFFARHQRFPTYREIGEALGYADHPSGASQMLKALAKKGAILWTGKAAGRYGVIQLPGLSPLLELVVKAVLDRLLGRVKT